MDYTQALNKYFNMQTSTPKTKQVVMLYDNMISNIQTSLEAYKESDFQKFYNKLSSTQKILDGLQASLDFENGEDIALILNDYYNNLNSKLHLIQRIMKEHPEQIDSYYNDILIRLQEMRDAWEVVYQTT
jgi:flagellar biosynthetic protein FliS